MSSRVTLTFREGGTIVLYEPCRLYVTKSAEAWVARGLDRSASGRSPRAALEAWATVIRDETASYLRAPMHTLTPEQRMRARVLFGVVDVIASKIGPRDEMTWVTGQLVREGGEVVLVTEDGGRHPLPAKWHGEIDVAAPYRVARVRSTSAGGRTGPCSRSRPRTARMSTRCSMRGSGVPGTAELLAFCWPSPPGATSKDAQGG